MGHSTSSGRNNTAPAATEALRRGDVTTAARAQESYDRGRVATTLERRAVENFLNRATNINSEQGQQVASNEFEFANMTNERAVEVLNAMGRGQYELVSYTARRHPGPASPMNPNYITRYIRRRR